MIGSGFVNDIAYETAPDHEVGARLKIVRGRGGDASDVNFGKYVS